MTEQIMDIDALHKFIANVFSSSKVLVRENNRIVTIEPIQDKKYRCPFLGTAKGGSLTVDKFLEMKREEKELEAQNDKLLFP
ncbi:MAG: hypothetical protein LBJ64_11680 [Deltaproteobacteria bacterium]|jgi:hypothetical protein|nr:hypothetical protein [Deltaproteobacteria bacterium]